MLTRAPDYSLFTLLCIDTYLRLHMDHVLPNNSIVPPGDLNTGILCCSSTDVALDSSWAYPNGSNVISSVQGQSIFAVQRQNCIELILESGRQVGDEDEGLYRCNIRNSALFVGIYSLRSYENSSKPILCVVDYFVVYIKCWSHLAQQF